MLDKRVKKAVKYFTACFAAAGILVGASFLSTYISDIYSTETYISAAYCDNSSEDGEMVYSEVDGIYDYTIEGSMGGMYNDYYVTLPYPNEYFYNTVPANTEPQLLDTDTTELTHIEAVPLFVDSEIIATTTAPTETKVAATTVKKTTTKVNTTTAPKTTTAKTTTADVEAATAVSTSKKPFINSGEVSYSSDDSIYLTMLNLVNDARAEQGIAPLKYSAEVHEVAQQRATEISTYYSHDRASGKGFYTVFTELGLDYTRCGENIAYGLNTFETVEEVFNAWMKSPSHYKNIMNEKFEYVGFGFTMLKNGARTYYYWSQEFATFD